MNRFLKLSAFMAAVSGMSFSARGAFTAGDLVIMSDPTGVAQGTITLNDYAYNPATGVLSTTPTSHALSGITIPSTGDHDGLLNVSTNGNYITFGGYTGASQQSIGVVDSNWNVSTVPVSGYSPVGGAPTTLRSVTSTDGKHFWTAGYGKSSGNSVTDGGQYYIDASGTTVTQTQLENEDTRANLIYNGQLWSVSSATSGASTVGTGLPTSAASLSNKMNKGDVKSDIVFVNVGGTQVAYATDGKNLIGKYYFNGTSWVEASNGSYGGLKSSINDINSLEAYVFNGTVELFAATQEGQLFEFVDSSAPTAGFSPAFLANTAPTPYLTAPGGAQFRGMAILVPEPATLSLISLAAPLLLRRRRASDVR